MSDRFFTDRNWTKAGGMWGDAQWKQLRSDLVVSLGGGYTATDTLDTSDFLQAPKHLDWPCCLYVYRAPFWPNWTVAEGECPVEDVERCEQRIFPSVYDAVAFVDTLVDSAA